MPEKTQTLAEKTQTSAEGGGFTAITTQEEFDRAIKDRLNRAEKSFEHKFKEEHKDVFEKAAEFEKLEEANKTELQKAQDQLANATKQLEGYRHKAQVATWAQEASEKYGIPANILRGDTQEEIESHAQSLKNFYEGKPASSVVESDGFAVTKKKTGSTREQFAETMDELF